MAKQHRRIIYEPINERRATMSMSAIEYLNINYFSIVNLVFGLYYKTKPKVLKPEVIG